MPRARRRPESHPTEPVEVTGSGGATASGRVSGGSEAPEAAEGIEGGAGAPESSESPGSSTAAPIVRPGPADLRRLELSDPRALRAMAHPTRLTLVGLLRREGPLTATQAAEHVGQSPSSCSFHLRQLAKWGLVEEAPGGRGRERPWRATAELSNWQQAPVRGEAGEARTALDRVLAGRYLEQIDRWLQRRADEPERWLALSGLGDWTLYVTADELEEIERQVDAVVEPYLRRSVDREIRPADARPVLFIHALLPEAQP